MSALPTLAIRRATAADAPALGRLGALLVAIHHEFDSKRFIAPTAQTARGYAAFLGGELQRQDRVVLVAEEAGAVVGYAYAGLEGQDWMSLRGAGGAIYDIIVDPARRREGLGRRLLDETLDALAALGAPQVVLSTATPNETAQRLFAASGFRPTMVEMTRELPE